MSKEASAMDSTKALRKIQETELSILETISRFRDENGIRFFIDGGTLLGAVRHGGFIPWDDDIDIGMLREDYDKFCKLAEDGLPAGYSLHTSTELEGLCGAVRKGVQGRSPSLQNQEGRDAGSSMGIFVDVFPYDRLYEDGSLRRTQIKSASMAQRRCVSVSTQLQSQFRTEVSWDCSRRPAAVFFIALSALALQTRRFTSRCLMIRFPAPRRRW